MTIETIGPLQPVIKIDGKNYTLNVREYESFVLQCAPFMDVEIGGMAAMAESISDQLIDLSADHMRMDELRPQLKFLRELSLLFKGVLSPVPNPDQD